MRNFSRSLLLTGALAFTGVLAGCGDDVTVTETTPSVVVSGAPAAAIKVGDKVQLTANTPVTWATSNAAVATVDNAGLVTAVGVGTASITGTSTTDANNRGSATIVVASKGVRSVQVNPPNSVLAPGQKLQAGVTVDADPGVAKTVTWASSAAAVATVNATTGEITAVAQGAATITAASTVDPTVTGTMALTVRPAQPATVSISSITVTGTAGTTVNQNAVVGNIDVNLNVDPGDQPISRVEVLLDGNVVCSQAFSGAQAEALRLAAVFADVEAAPVLCQISTAAFNATTGAPNFLNGAHVLSARAVLTNGNQTATPSQNLIFNNANAFVSNMTLGGTTASATGTNGLAYRRGSLTVSVLPVIYSTGLTMAAGSITFGSAACDASPTNSGRTAALTAPAGGTGAWTATLAQTATGGPAATNVVDYEFDAVNCPAGTTAVGEVITLNATDSNGNQLFAGATPAAGTAGIRLDNRAPGAPTFVVNPNARQNGWINGGVGLAGVNTSATDNDWLKNGAADAGVGGYTRMLRIGDGTAGTVNAAKAATASATPTLPAPSTANTSLCAVATATDALGNESALPADGAACTAPQTASFQDLSVVAPATASSTQFGVDIAPPTIAFSGGLASNARLNGGTVGGEFQVTVADTGTVGNSGMLTGSSVVGTVTLRNATATGAATCVVGTFTSGVCNPASVNPAPAFPLVPTVAIAAQNTTGYYTYTAVSQDAAGNQSGSVTRVIAYDPAANVPSLTTALFNTPLSGSTATFTANASDNFDLRDVTYSLTYAGAGLPGPFVFPAAVLNTFNTPPLVKDNVSAGITLNGFMRQIEPITGNAPVAVSGAFKPSQISGNVRDQANNSSGAVNTAIAPASVTTGTSYLAAPAAQLVRSFAITNAATNVSDGNVTAPTVPANPLSVTLNADAFGPTATFNPPFTRVDFYAVIGGNLVQIASATGVSTVDDGSAFGRRHRYSASWTPGTAAGLGAITIYAIGVNTNGDALVSPANANITVTNP
jgi:Big-like domain-containing protein